MERKRLTAVKTKIGPVIKGRFVKQEGFTPNYVLTSNGLRVSRANILATVVDKFVSETGKFASITLDDGSGTIRAKVFNAVSVFEGIETGDIVDCIGRIKEYQGEIYIMPEILRKVDDPDLEMLRELDIRKRDREWNNKRELVLEYQNQTADAEELKKIMNERFNVSNEDVESILQTQQADEEVSEKENETKEKVLKFIVECDKGEGCDYSELLDKSGLPEETIDSLVNELLSEGMCFEPRPGKIKKL